MSLYAQHGYAKSDLIETALKRGFINGVVLSPKDENKTEVTRYAKGLKARFGRNVTILFDPQFYVGTLRPQKSGNLPSYAYFVQSLNRGSFAADKIREYAANTVDFQLNAGFDKVVSPTVLISDLNDFWSQITLQLGEACVNSVAEHKSKKPLLVSLVFDEQSLRSDDKVDEFLDALTLMKGNGFYLVMNPKHSSYPALCDENALANFMYMIYVLTEINHLEAVCGYSDFVGVLLHAAGATSTATGWFKGLRQFSVGRFQPSSGGQQPKPRYTSQPLLSSIRLDPELKAISDRGELKSVLSGTSYDSALLPDPAKADWPYRISYLHHWQVLNNLITRVSTGKNMEARLAITEKLIQNALDLYKKFEGRNAIPFRETSSKDNLSIWQSAINQFRERAEAKS